MQIFIDDSAIQQKIDEAADKLANTAPLMQSISLSLLDTTEENFNAEGRPKWAGLNPEYASRKKGDAILQLSGQLAASITPYHGPKFAGVGTNKVYAAIHHFGGQTSPHLIKPKNKQALAFGGGVFKQVQHPGSRIPSRPFMPMDKQGNIQAEAYDDILEITDLYLKKAF